MLVEGESVLDEESAALAYVPYKGEVLTFSSSGGFSNYFARPAYQMDAVETYLEKHNPGYPSYVADATASNIGAGGGLYNRAGRAFP